jgi:preprotein translocase subunit SecA
MRLFQSDRIAGLMDKMGHQDGDVIQHSMVTKSIERAQTKVEENNFGIRKRLLEYDDVMNIQREAIYKKRRNALFGDRLALDINDAFDSITSELVQSHRQGGDFETFRLDSIRAIGVDPELDAAWFKSAPVNSVLATYQDQVFSLYNHKSKQVGERLMPFIKNVVKNEGMKYRRMVVPFKDGMMGLNINTDIQIALDNDGKTIMRDVEKVATLALLDDAWKEHLRNVDDLKESVQSASFEQKDPLVIYKMEAYNLFEGLIGHINSSVTSFLLKGTLDLPDENDIRRNQQAEAQRAAQIRAQQNRLRTNASAAQNSSDGQPMTEHQVAAREAAQRVNQQPVQRIQPIIKEKVVGRNEPCPCGSGKKYKNCHG